MTYGQALKLALAEHRHAWEQMYPTVEHCLGCGQLRIEVVPEESEEAEVA